MLEVLYPAHARLGCQVCRKYEIDWDLVAPKVFRGTEKRIKRDPKSLCPCETKEGCPVGHYDNPKCLSDKNQKAYYYYLRCCSTGQQPEDELARENATIIYHANQSAERHAECQHRKNMEQIAMAQLDVLRRIESR